MKSVSIKLKVSIVIGNGLDGSAGQVVTVDEATAKYLIARNVAEVANTKPEETAKPKGRARVTKKSNK